MAIHTENQMRLFLEKTLSTAPDVHFETQNLRAQILQLSMFPNLAFEIIKYYLSLKKLTQG